MSKKIEDIIESQNWTNWIKFPFPQDFGWEKGSNKNNLRQILRKILSKPYSIGVYQLRNIKTNENILFGITTTQTLEIRMSSLLPSYSGGRGGRNNTNKIKYVNNNVNHIEFRVLYSSKSKTKIIEDYLKLLKNHRFNT